MSLDTTACRAKLIDADKNSDDRLDETEFVDIVKQFSDGAFGKVTSLESLPSVLQVTFARLSSPFETIHLAREKEDRVDEICDEINSSIHQAFISDKPAVVVHPCPQLLAHQSRNLQSLNVTFLECVIAMNSADNNNDNLLNQNEYIAFVNLLSNGQYQGESLATVPAEIRQNFFQLAGDNGQIDISGSKPGDGQTPEQIDNLQNICTSTVNAINAVEGAATESPTSAPSPSSPDSTTAPPVTTPPPTGPTAAVPGPTDPPATPPPTPEGTENVIIPSSFVISNTAGLSAQDISSSGNFNDLTEAYGNLAKGVVAELSQGRRVRRRRLVVSYTENSARIASISDMQQCPAGTTEGSSLCQMVLASYKVSVANEDAEKVKSDYTTATNAAIKAGDLQEELEVVNPSTQINIVEDVPAAPTSAPTAAPSGDDGLSNGAIAGIAVAGAVVVAGLGAALFFIQRKHVPPGKKVPLGHEVDQGSIDSFGAPIKVASTRQPQHAYDTNPFGASETPPAAAITSTRFSDESDTDDSGSSFDSGSFHENEEPQSPFRSAASQVVPSSSPPQRYEFDDPPDKRYTYGAAVVGAPGVRRYSSSSNSSSSGWSTGEEDTDEIGESSSTDESDNSLFDDEKIMPGQSRVTFSENTSPPYVMSAPPLSQGSGSYDDSTFSSDFTPLPSTPPEADRSLPVPVPIPMPRRGSDEESSDSYTSSNNSSYHSSALESEDSSSGSLSEEDEYYEGENYKASQGRRYESSARY